MLVHIGPLCLTIGDLGELYLLSGDRSSTERSNGNVKGSVKWPLLSPTKQLRFYQMQGGAEHHLQVAQLWQHVFLVTSISLNTSSCSNSCQRSLECLIKRRACHKLVLETVHSIWSQMVEWRQILSLPVHSIIIHCFHINLTFT